MDPLTSRYCALEPSDFFALVLEGFPQRDPIFDRRQRKRYRWATQASVRPDGDSRIIRVATHDISTTGCSVVLRPFLHIGSRLVLVLDDVEGCPAAHCTVRHCEYHEGMMHRAGLQFDEPREQDLAWDEFVY